jgi:hypothetical protein
MAPGPRLGASAETPGVAQTAASMKKMITESEKLPNARRGERNESNISAIMLALAPRGTRARPGRFADEKALQEGASKAAESLVMRVEHFIDRGDILAALTRLHPEGGEYKKQRFHGVVNAVRAKLASAGASVRSPEPGDKRNAQESPIHDGGEGAEAGDANAGAADEAGVADAGAAGAADGAAAAEGAAPAGRSLMAELDRAQDGAPTAGAADGAAAAEGAAPAGLTRSRHRERGAGGEDRGAGGEDRPARGGTGGDAVGRRGGARGAIITRGVVFYIYINQLTCGLKPKPLIPTKERTAGL